MTDERRIADPKDVALRDLEEGEIQAEGSTNKDQTARDDPPPASAARVDLHGEKSKETPRAGSLLPELLQKMSTTLDALLESAERQNRANGTITDELRSIGADVRARPLEPVSTFGDDGSARRVARQTTTKTNHANPQRMTQQNFSAFDDQIDPGYARRISEEEKNIEWVKQAEVAEAKQAAVRAQHYEMAEFRASLSKTAAELKTIRSQIHRATSKAPELDLILVQAQHTPFSERITKA
ncbi:hypothetical protein AALP_AAs70859U000100 [Arabis alpina]|uniref:Uncharacterized protein n=1 Tax=Arabis alpina TaxID=50452 RepID=A0A087FWQ3_ARAAL|nr:hypothetical protein AALP_AAs70859U000100 [Arabis alpina]